GDFNGDGHPDIVLGGYADNRVDVFLNDGDGTFAAPGAYPLGWHSGSLQTGDVKNDGYDDIIDAYAGNNGIAILLANSDGTFQPRSEVSPGIGSPGTIAVVDLDTDGNLDIVAAVPGANRAVV